MTLNNHNLAKSAPVFQPRDIARNRPLSSRRLNTMLDEMLRDILEIFNTELPDLASLKTQLDSINAKRYQSQQTADRLVAGGTHGLEQGDHTENWRTV